ncbi:hypothetical protein [Tardiphaga sp. 841_E9_N1_2]|uniref:hypothetical protein n=1 Tax=Tardiphaga sp. 841_E9_N1_2 TaxID=3240762 RepID=UPI003F1F1D6C
MNFVPPSTTVQTSCTTMGPVALICVRPIQSRGRSQAITSQSSATGPDRVDQCSWKVSPKRIGRSSQSMSCEEGSHCGHDFGLVT